MRLAYFPGCSLDSTGIEYALSTKVIAKEVDLELWEIPEWNCCGSSAAHLSDELLALSLPARNLAIAEEEGLDTAVPCAACFARLRNTEMAVRNSLETRARIEEVIERTYAAKFTVKSMLEVFAADIGCERFRKLVLRPLEGLRVVTYYGCLLVRPPQLQPFDDPEDPTAMDNLLKAVGADVPYWGYKTECCGSGHALVDPKLAHKVLRDIYEGAKAAEADVIAAACPMCVMNLDMRQKEVAKAYQTHYNIPILYFTELLGLALGAEPVELGLNRHFVPALPILKERGLLHPVKRGEELE